MSELLSFGMATVTWPQVKEVFIASQAPGVTKDGATDILSKGLAPLFNGGGAGGVVSKVIGVGPILASPMVGDVVVSHATSGVTAGVYGSASQVPTITFDPTGHASSVVLTAITPSAIGAQGASAILLAFAGLTAGSGLLKMNAGVPSLDTSTYMTSLTLSGDITGSGSGSISTTLASILVAGGPVGSGSIVPVLTWDAKGRILSVGTAAITAAGIGAEPAFAVGVASQVLLGTKSWGQISDSQVATAAAIAWSKISKSGALPGDVGALAVGGTAAAATKLATGRTIGITGDATWTSPAFDGTGNVTAVLSLANIITAGGPIGSASVVPVLSWDAHGRLTVVTTAAILVAWSAITSKPTTIAGYGITDAQAALGYAPVNKAGDSGIGALQINYSSITGGAKGLQIGATGNYLAGSSASLAIGIPTAATSWPLEIQKNGVAIFSVDTTGTLNNGIVPVARVTGLAAVATSASASDLTTGQLLAARMPQLTGDVTTAGGSTATTLARIQGVPVNILTANGVAQYVDGYIAWTAVGSGPVWSQVGVLRGSGYGGSGQFLTSAGASTAPVWTTLTHNQINDWAASTSGFVTGGPYLPVNNPVFTGILNGPAGGYLGFAARNYIVDAGTPGAVFPGTSVGDMGLRSNGSIWLGIGGGSTPATMQITGSGVGITGTLSVSNTISEGGVSLASKYALASSLGALATKSLVTWTSDLSGVPFCVAGLGNPAAHGGLRISNNTAGGWHGIEFSDAKTTRLLVNGTGGSNYAGIYDATASDSGWLFGFDRSSTLVRGYVPWARVTGVPVFAVTAGQVAIGNGSSGFTSSSNLTASGTSLINGNTTVGTASGGLAFVGKTWTTSPTTSVGLTTDGGSTWLNSGGTLLQFGDATHTLGQWTNATGLQINTGMFVTGPINGTTWLPPVYHSVSGQMPTLGPNQAVLLIEDEHPQANVLWMTPTGQYVNYRDGGIRVMVNPNTPLPFASNNTTMMMFGPTYAGSVICSLLIC